MTTIALLADGREIRIVIQNVNQHGFMAAALTPPQAGFEPGVALPRFGIVRACVRWVDGSEFGASFSSDLLLAAFVAF